MKTSSPFQMFIRGLCTTDPMPRIKGGLGPGQAPRGASGRFLVPPMTWHQREGRYAGLPSILGELIYSLVRPGQEWRRALELTDT